MEDLIQRALSAKRESKHIEFKSAFDPSSPQDWCELVKDIAAIANTGGGVLVFGADNAGNPCGFDVQPILQLDTATITDKVARYTTVQFSEFEVVQAEQSGAKMALLLISPVDIPLVFSNPGTYALPNGKQQTAFSRGVERNLEAVRALHGVDSNEAFAYRPRFSSPQYSQVFVDWLISQYRANNNFFREARRVFTIRHGGS